MCFGRNSGCVVNLTRAMLAEILFPRRGPYVPGVTSIEAFPRPAYPAAAGFSPSAGCYRVEIGRVVELAGGAF